MPKKSAAPRDSTGPSKRIDAQARKRLKWWKEARFGMFIHWGLYAIPAGRWKGRYYSQIGEWIMHSAKIPAREYEQLAPKFNPVKFNADEWVGLAKRAGMKYLTITSKHHDGFAMFDSPCTEYDIVDATPYGKDPMKALAKACKKHGIKFCFYYSQTQDWYERDAVGNTWDYTPPTRRAFGQYLRRKVKPQLRELLTQYGPIGIIWFDTPMSMTLRESRDLQRFVHSIQPKCIVSGRIGNDIGDYGSLGDNQVPRGPVPSNEAWETPATLNDTWAFKTDDKEWKSERVLLRLMVDLASKGINYLLNVGPTAEGIIPKPSVTRLEAIGRWLSTNGDAIYGTEANPFPYEFSWGRITRKGTRLYLHFFDWPRGRFRLVGLRNRVGRARLLADPKAQVVLEQSHETAADTHEVVLRLPAKRPDKHVTVVELTLSGKPDAVQTPLPQSDGTIELPAHLAEIHNPARGKTAILGHGGVMENWTSKRSWVSWRFRTSRPGRYRIRVILGTSRNSRTLVSGHRVEATVGTQRSAGTLTRSNLVDSVRTRYFKEAVTDLGAVELRSAGAHELKIRALRINSKAPVGLVLAGASLVPAG